MDNTNKIDLGNGIVLEFQSDTTPLARFEEYNRLTEEALQKNTGSDSEQN